MTAGHVHDWTTRGLEDDDPRRFCRGCGVLERRTVIVDEVHVWPRVPLTFALNEGVYLALPGQLPAAVPETQTALPEKQTPAGEAVDAGPDR